MLTRIKQVTRKIIKLAGESLQTTFPAKCSVIRSRTFVVREKALRKTLNSSQQLAYDARKSLVQKSDLKHRRHFLTFLSALLGWPTRNFTWDKKTEKEPNEYGYNLLQNVAALPEKRSATRLQKRLSRSYIFPILYTLWNVALIPLKLPINLFRLFTEFLPNYTFRLSYALGQVTVRKLRVLSDDKGISSFAKLFLGVFPALGLLIAILGVSASRFIEFFTLAFSSPRMAANRFLVLSRNAVKDGDPLLVWVYRGLMVLSVLVSLAVQIAFFGFILPALLLWGTVTLPTALATACENIVIAFLSFSNAITPFFAPIGSIFSSILNYLIPSLIITISDATMGASAVVGSIALSSGILMQYVKGLDSDWFHRDALMKYLQKPSSQPSTPEEDKKDYREVKRFPLMHQRSSSFTTMLTSPRSENVVPPPTSRSQTPRFIGTHMRSLSSTAIVSPSLMTKSTPGLALRNFAGQTVANKDSPVSPFHPRQNNRMRHIQPLTSPGSSPPNVGKPSPSASPSSSVKGSPSPKRIDVRHIDLPDRPPSAPASPSALGKSNRY